MTTTGQASTGLTSVALGDIRNINIRRYCYRGGAAGKRV
jgi:hypothetical protein